MNKAAWLLKLRRCTSKDTLDKIIEKKRHGSGSDDLEGFYAAADHRLAKLTMNRLYDKIPPSVWQWVR